MRWLPVSELGFILIVHGRPQQAKSVSIDWDFFGHYSGAQGWGYAIVEQAPRSLRQYPKSAFARFAFFV